MEIRRIVERDRECDLAMTTKPPKKDLASKMAPRTQSPSLPVAQTFTSEENKTQTYPTSIRLPNELRKEAKLYALQHDTTLQQLIIEGLTVRIEQ